MSLKKHEFSFEMTCEGCSGAAVRVLKKIGVAEDNVIADIPNKKLYVTSDKQVDELLETIRKTGKKTDYIGEA